MILQQQQPSKQFDPFLLDGDEFNKSFDHAAHNCNARYEPDVADQFEDEQEDFGPDEAQEWHDYDPDC